MKKELRFVVNPEGGVEDLGEREERIKRELNELMEKNGLGERRKKVIEKLEELKNKNSNVDKTEKKNDF